MKSGSSSSQNSMWKWLTLLVLAIFSFYVAYPPVDKVDSDGQVIQEGKLRFGLDLKGGTSFTLGVDRAKLREQIIADNPSISNDNATIEKKISEVLVGCDNRIVQVVRRRVDGMGMNEPVIQNMSDHRLLVQLPGVGNETRAAAKKSLQSAAYLEFRLTHPRNDELVSRVLSLDVAPEGYKKGGSGYIRAENYQEVSAQEGYFARLAMFHSPDPRYQFMLENAGDGSFRPAYVARNSPCADGVRFSGDFLESARVDLDAGQIAIAFTMNAEGARRFGEITRNYVAGGPKNPTGRGRQLAIILDNVLISAPTIQSEIRDRGQITGHFTAQEAQELANDLNAGALPAPLQILAESSVAPTVGQEAINAGLIAATLGFLLVAIFMFIYYWYTGLVANIALFLDIVLLPAALVVTANILGVFAQDASMGGQMTTQLPVLTMPGIAGLVLTLGMAVDANVLIFERIREEFLNKASVGTAIKNGYGNAFSAIFDSNLTTIITGTILFVVGTGPVRGFAITLVAGVIISMFTAVVVTRLLLEKFSNPDSVKPFRMLQFFKKPSFDFIKCGKITMLSSLVVIVITVGLFFFRVFTKPASVLAVDLTGGTSIVYSLDSEKKPAVSDIRKVLDPFDNATVIQYQEGVGATTLLVKTGFTAESVQDKSIKDVGGHVTKLLQDAFKDAKLELVSVDEIGSMVGADLKRSGTWAVILSLCAILIYVGFRFEFGFGLGAIVALAHDALITLGIFSLCGRQVSLIVVTALLTIIGYSVNDTIVIFDRIREDLRKNNKLTFAELCNNSLNSCLSRTVITSLTTLFAVLALFAFGDGSIFDFAFTMLLGIIAGTYSTMFIATPIMMWFYKNRRPEFKDEESSED